MLVNICTQCKTKLATHGEVCEYCKEESEELEQKKDVNHKPTIVKNKVVVCESCGCESWNDLGDFCENDDCTEYCGK